MKLNNTGIITLEPATLFYLEVLNSYRLLSKMNLCTNCTCVIIVRVTELSFAPRETLLYHSCSDSHIASDSGCDSHITLGFSVRINADMDS